MRLEVGSSVTRWCGRSVRLLLPKQPRYVTHALGYRTVATSQREKKLCQNSLNARRTYTRRRPSYFVSLHVQQRLFSVSFPLYVLPPSISMPTYHARSITVRLGSLPLAETTTSDVVLKKGEVAKRQTEAAEKKLLRSFLLDEKRILFPGDPDGYELNWLGNAPFMQVQADAGVSQSSGLYRGAHRPYASEDNRLRALSLHVKLSDKAFVSGFAGKTHLKIEVLFNGQLSTCSLVHTNDIRSGAKSFHQVFAGSRVDFLAERPWVLLPPYTTADGGTRRLRKTITPPERWSQISTAILEEADERGTNRDGKASPSAEFLRALAKMRMPDAVTNMQKPGGRKFGIVDVLITAGTGNKLTTGTNYLKKPQRLRDPTYAVRAEAAVEDEIDTVELDRVQHTTYDPLRETDIDRLDASADERADSDDERERPRKRRALSPPVNLSKPAAHDETVQSPFCGAQVPYLPPPDRSMSKNGLSSVAGRVSPRCPSPEHRSEGHKQPLPLYDHHRTYETTCGTSKSQDCNNTAARISQEYHSPAFDLELGASRPLSLHATSPHTSLSQPTFGASSVNGHASIDPILCSYPMPRMPAFYSPSFAQSRLTSEHDMASYPSVAGFSIPYIDPTALMQPATTDWRPPQPAVAPPCHNPVHIPQQALLSLYASNKAPYMRPNGLPSLLPQIPPALEYPESVQYATPAASSSPVLHFSAPLPPKAMFTVTSKPRQSASPAKDTASTHSDTSCAGTLVSRLVITGLEDKVIVDYRWKVAQRILTNQTGMARGKKTIPKPERDSTTTRSCARKQSSHHAGTSLSRSRAKSSRKKPQRDAVQQRVPEQRRDSVQDGQTSQSHEVSLPYLKKHERPANEELPINPKIDVPDKIAPFVTAPFLNLATLTVGSTRNHTTELITSSALSMPQRRNLSRINLPGVQGPKAPSFLLDDPEEMLREAARMRRSRSPTKPTITPSVLSSTPPTQLKATTGQEGTGGSSPLSSVPSSPAPAAASTIDEAAGAAVDQISQLDGSPERTLPATSPRKVSKSSPTKSILPRPSPVTPQSSPSPESRKRKGITNRSYTKPPRSPDRLKTVENPPLNNDCVIAFAESKGKNEERGVLRQVKGERQGVFKEEYVALAVRFFIAGD